MSSFWNKYNLPVQDQYIDVDSINPAEAYRRQADAINYSAPLYAELESLEHRLERVLRVEKELRTKILAQNMPLPSTSTRTNDLVDAFVLNNAPHFRMEDGTIRDVSSTLMKFAREKSKLLLAINKTERRLKALESMAEKCDRILNWSKHEARLELGR